jgi:hypothetical protein
MDQVKSLSRETQVVLGCAVLFLIISFLDWQQVSFSSTFVSGAVGLNLWHGIGVVAGLLVIALLIWELVRLFGVNTPTGNVTEGHVSIALALALALFTVIAFFDKSTARHWPAWIGLILALVIAVAAVVRAREEGVQLPTKTASPAAEAAAPAAAEPVAAEPAPAPAEPEPEAETPEAPAAPEN